MAETLIDADTLSAYRATRYVVFSETPFALHIDRQSEELLSVYAATGAHSALFITAFNPFGQPLSDAENARRNLLLERELQRFGLRYFIGLGEDPYCQWPAESSFLVLDADLERSKALGQQFEQNAIIWCGSDAVPGLVLLR